MLNKKRRRLSQIVGAFGDITSIFAVLTLWLQGGSVCFVAFAGFTVTIYALARFIRGTDPFFDYWACIGGLCITFPMLIIYCFPVTIEQYNWCISFSHFGIFFVIGCMNYRKTLFFWRSIR